MEAVRSEARRRIAAPRVGLVGHGWWARRYLVPALAAAGAELTAVCGRDADRAAEAARDLGASHSYGAVDQMLAGVELDAVAVASPPASHLATVLAAASQGIAVFCEKPLARSAEETRQMVEACADLPTVVGFTQRWNASIRYARELVRDGRVGAIRQIRYSTASALSALATAGWDWRYDGDEYSYGILSDLGPHAVDLLRWFAGEIVEVTATAHTAIADRTGADGLPRPVQNWDDCTMALRFESGAYGSAVLSRLLPISPYRRFRHELEVIGDAGTLSYTSDRPAEVVLAGSHGTPEVLRPAGLDTGSATPGSFEELAATMSDGSTRQGRDMVAAFRGTPSPEAPTIVDGHRAQHVLDAAAAAARGPRWQRCLPPAK